MSWYNQGGPPAGGNSAGTNQSFSSRISNFSDIADISIDHLQFDDTPEQQPRPQQQQQQAQNQYYQETNQPAPTPTPTPAYQQQYQQQQQTQTSQTQHQHGVQNSGIRRVESTASAVSAVSSGYYGNQNTTEVGRSDTMISALSNSSRAQQSIRPSESAISLQSQFDEQGQPLRGRESVVSMQSYYDPPTAQPDPYNQGHTYSAGSTSSWSGFRSSGYEPVSTPSAAPSRNSSYSSGSRASGRGGYSLGFSGEHEAIPEEEYDMAILPAAAPMGQDPRYSSVPDNEPSEPVFDPTSTLGPMGLQDEAFIKKLQEQEAGGRLTGGLGSGWKPETRLLGSELLRQPSQMKRSLTRSFTRRPKGHDPVREIGQEEANRRGEIIEVVIDQPAGVDISAMVGPDVDDGGDTESTRNTVLPTRKTTETFYPQPNWKPFSMRWPYLGLLIILSIALAAMSEILYQKSQKSPLLKFKDPNDVSPGIYFALKFLPTLCAVTYGVLWQVTDFEVKRLEAFYQLSKPGGALAGESINVDYITSKTFLRPIRALRLKHWAVAVSSFATVLAVSLVPTFGAAAIKLQPSRNERSANPDIEKYIVINQHWSRLLTVTLSFCAVCGCILLYLLQTRRTGLQNDVKGIAGLASMAVVSHILMDFKGMDIAKHEEIHHKLKYRRYMLRNSALAPDSDNPVSSQAQDEGRFEHAHLSDNPHPVMLRAVGCIPFIVGVILFMGFIPAFLFTKANVLTDQAPWVITAIAVVIKLSWGTLDTDVRMMEPYYILSNRNAPSKTLTLDYAAMPFGYLPWRAFLNGHRIMFLVGAGSVIAEVLTVLLTSLATVNGNDFVDGVKELVNGGGDDDDENNINSGQETVMSFWVSLAFAMIILCYLAVVATVVFIRRRHYFLPRQPNTISSILAYIHQSKMLYDFVGTSKLNNAEMVTKLDEVGKTYGLGWFQGRDGQTHCGVDQEELISKYTHGVGLGQVNKPWDTQWEVF